ncbi:HutD family protein [Phreatobacter sp. AB_2022a]|nr:HutD family protein [Phreatobacter sp. AB_2022a]
MKHLRAAGHRRMPWKNGGGETAEIAVHPESAGLADFGWRVSMATVASDGPFSLFPGIDRTLAVLTGAGIRLDVEGLGTRRLTPASPPLPFPADAPAGARLIDGTITDLNVMTRRGRYRHSLTPLTATGRQTLALATRWTLLMAVDALEAVTGEGTLRLAPLDVLVVEGAAQVTLAAANGTARCYRVAIEEEA